MNKHINTSQNKYTGPSIFFGLYVTQNNDTKTLNEAPAFKLHKPRQYARYFFDTNISCRLYFRSPHIPPSRLPDPPSMRTRRLTRSYSMDKKYIHLLGVYYERKRLNEGYPHVVFFTKSFFANIVDTSAFSS